MNNLILANFGLAICLLAIGLLVMAGVAASRHWYKQSERYLIASAFVTLVGAFLVIYMTKG